jgi:phenylacetate-CoA ligase
MMYSLYRYGLLPAFESVFKRRQTWRYWKELERTQWLPADELRRLQFESLRRLITHSFTHCPYYRAVWQERGLEPGRLRHPDDFLAWPLVNRDIIRAHRLEMRSQLPGVRLIDKATGGSNGTPLQFDIDPQSYEWRNGIWFRGYAWAGAEPGTKQLWLWGVPLGKTPSWKLRRERWYSRLYRRYTLNTFEFSDDRLEEFLAKHNRYRPDVVVAYTNPLFSFAQLLEEKGLVPYSPRSVGVGAEKLYDFQRKVIERVFRAPVFETYGSREFTLIAAECDRHEGLHLSMENLLVEVLDEEGRPTPAGEEGNLVVTDLHNYGMPFIRYVIGDRAVAGWATCSCGRGLPLLKKVVGRQLDVLRTPDGRQVPGEFFPHLLKEFASVRRFQVVQEEPDRIELRVVLKGEWTEADQRLLDKEVRHIIGPQMRYDLVPVEDIPLTVQGKLRVVVNHCPTATTPP